VKFPVHQGFRVVVQRIACGADHTFAIVTVWSASPNTCLQGLVLKASSCDGSLRGVKQRVEYPDLRGIYRGEFFEALRLALLVLGTP